MRLTVVTSAGGLVAAAPGDVRTPDPTEVPPPVTGEPRTGLLAGPGQTIQVVEVDDAILADLTEPAEFGERLARYLAARGLLTGLLVAIAVVVGTTTIAVPAAAFGPFGPSTCTAGNVWREATPADHVCVDPRTRDFVRLDNRNPNQFRNPADPTYGPDTCQQGFVWREATPDDHLCVAPRVRDVHRQFNETAAQRWEATVSRRGENTLVPFVQFAEQRRLHSVYSGRNDLVVNAADMRVQPDGNRPTQRFRFLRRGDRVAYQNAFQIQEVASGQCLSVAGGSTGNGAGLALEGCGWRDNQSWHLQRRADDRWQLQVWHSGKCLDADNPALTAPPPGARLQQWDCIGGQNQAWNLTG